MSYRAAVPAPAAPTMTYVEQTVPHPETACTPSAVLPGYWIVSSRHCPQDSTQLVGACRLDYYHVDAGGHMQHHDQHAFQAGFQPDRPVCVMIHGSFVNWETMLNDSRRTYAWLGRATGHVPQFVFYTWPSHELPRLSFVANVESLGRRADVNGFYLAQTMRQLPTQSPVCVIGHSHGTRVASSSLHLLSGGAIQGKALLPGLDRGHRIRTIFFAAALDHHWLRPGEIYQYALHRTESLLNVRNEQDLALALYGIRRPFARPALARVGLTRNDVDALGPLAYKVSEIDVKELVRAGHIWPYYYTRPEIANAIAPFVMFH